MPVQMIELEEVQMVERNDDFLENAGAGVRPGLLFSQTGWTVNGSGCCPC